MKENFFTAEKKMAIAIGTFVAYVIANVIPDYTVLFNI